MTLLPPTEVEHVRDTGSTGLVGNRKLVAVQTFDIGRLTTHPVPIVPSSFVAVSGEGPKGDSNGSGKTTFLSAVSLLLADPQWRLKRDGQFAKGLLFNPESAGVGEGGGGARRGYIVGVFSSEDGEDVRTVWLRIAGQPPYLQMRWVRGLHVADADTDQERANQADGLWERIPAKQGRGSHNMGAFLYGDAPRCLAYLDTSMRPMVASLLSQQMTSMSPDAIGNALIALTGRSHLLSREQEERVKYDQAARELDQQESDDENRKVSEKAQLDAIGRRERARTALRTATQAWELHLAKGLLEKEGDLKKAEEKREKARQELNEATAQRQRVKKRWEKLRKDTGLAEAVRRAEEERSRIGKRRTLHDEFLGGLKNEVDRLVRSRGELMRTADRYDGVGVAQRRTETERAQEDLVSARVRHKRAGDERESAQRTLERVRVGQDGIVGEAVQRLSELGVATRGVLDAVTLEEPARPEWEAHLWRFRDSVAVSNEDAEFALRSLRDLPGGSVIRVGGSPDEEPVPLFDGVTAPSAFGPFLAAIRSRFVHAGDPDRSHDVDLGEWVLSGFTDPVTGRQARVAAAQAVLNAAERAEEVAGQEVEAAQRVLDRCRELVEIAEAAEKLDRCKEELRTTEGRLAEARATAIELQREWDDVDLEHTRAQSALSNHELLVEAAHQDLRTVEERLGHLRQIHQDTNREVEKVGHQAWNLAWGRGSDTARRRIAGLENRAEQSRTFQEWWKQSSNSLLAALAAISQDRDTLPSTLADLIEAPAKGSDAVPAPGRDWMAFDDAVRPLRELLGGCEDHDAVVRSGIAEERAERERNIRAARTEVDKQHGELEIIRGAVADSIKLTLRSISERFDVLDRERDGGHGARLDYEVLDPSVTGSIWKVNVVPRWRRSPQGNHVSYRQVANGAQVKVFAIQLVLSALLADSDVSGRVLVLDELGNSLGDENRRDVLGMLQEVAVSQRVTILGTCQDSVVHDAVQYCGQVLWFNHVSDSEVYNRPTRSWGSDKHGRHVEHLAFWLRSGRS